VKPMTAMPSHFPSVRAEELTIRTAEPTDRPALERLAQLDSAPRPEPVPMLLAEVGGELRAALPLDGGATIANPFRRTAEVIELLRERARQLQPPDAVTARRRDPLRRRVRPDARALGLAGDR
jgi:hypothetical protein